MNRQEHYDAAETLLATTTELLAAVIDADDPAAVHVDGSTLEVARAVTALAQAHATLATTPVL